MQSAAASAESGYSPPLTITLVLHGEEYDVAAIGPETLALRNPRVARAGQGTVHVSIDGQPVLYHIDLFDGIDPTRQKQSFHHLGVTQEAAA